METDEIDTRTDEELELERTQKELSKVNHLIDKAETQFQQKNFTLKEYLELLTKQNELEAKRDRTIVKEIKVTWVESDYPTED